MVYNCPPDESVFTLADLAKLRKAIATGVKTIKYSDKEVTYNSIADMKEALILMESEIYPCAGINKPRRVYAQTSKGLC